ncbi:hypothetical protein NPX13_g5555 [Xylaria arbuscula]|uniref:Uncharacterized protein n=1 Tax=Xylaria arbuscula TaxID=114810 RepID=A0A9W8NE60_9PEZI|nr:hypothetical protein NPX13_g5555 [Xylaria arbuscula]
MPTSMASKIFFVLLLVLQATPSTAIRATNTTDPADVVVCVYPLSGQYGGLPRALYYASLIFAIFAHGFEWLAKWALATVMIFSSTAAVHALIITISQGTDPLIFDLDILGIRSLLVSTYCFLGFAMMLSPMIPRLAARLLFGIWGILILIGAIVSTVTCMWCGRISPRSKFFPRSSEVLCVTANCTYDCGLDTTSLVRDQTELLVVQQDVIYNLSYLPTWLLAYFSLIAGSLGFLVATLLTFSTALKQRVYSFSFPSGSATRGDGEIGRGTTLSVAATTDNAAERSRNTNAWPYTLGSGGGRAWRKPPWLVVHQSMVFNIILASLGITNIAVTEQYLWNKSFPQGEQPYAVGQWAPLVGAGFALLASLLVRIIQRIRGRSGEEAVTRT